MCVFGVRRRPAAGFSVKFLLAVCLVAEHFYVRRLIARRPMSHAACGGSRTAAVFAGINRAAVSGIKDEAFLLISSPFPHGDAHTASYALKQKIFFFLLNLLIRFCLKATVQHSLSASLDTVSAPNHFCGAANKKCPFAVQSV